jgi:hypothetical protein
MCLASEILEYSLRWALLPSASQLPWPALERWTGRLRTLCCQDRCLFSLVSRQVVSGLTAAVADDQRGKHQARLKPMKRCSRLSGGTRPAIYGTKMTRNGLLASVDGSTSRQAVCWWPPGPSACSSRSTDAGVLHAEKRVGGTDTTWRINIRSVYN